MGGRPRLAEPLRDWLGRRTSTQLLAAIAVLAAAALTGSLLVTGLAVRTDQRQQAALAALDDFAAVTLKLGEESTLGAEAVTAGDAFYLSSLLAALQSGPGRDAVSLEETCRTGRGGAGVRYIRAPVGKPAGLAALESARRIRLSRLGPDIYAVTLPAGALCPGRAVEAVVVRRPFGSLQVSVGRIVDRSGAAWGWRLFEVERLPTVHHLVSTVTGALKPGLGAADLLEATFPPGSITGAPKHQAMKVIAELEPPRGAWCGSLFLLDGAGALTASVLIRTAAFERTDGGWTWRAQAGAGIVADSDPQAELEETEVKFSALRRALMG